MPHSCLRIGLDARPLIKQYGGIPRYVYELVKELGQYENLTLVLFSHQPVHVPASIKAEVVIDNVYKSSPGTLWYSLRAGYLARKANLNLFWATNHIVPLGLPRNLPVVTTVHDLVYLRFPQTMDRKNLLIHKLLFASSLKRSTAIITCSKSIANEIRNAFPRQQKPLHTIFPGRLNAITPTPVPVPAAPYLLYVGAMEPRKNLNALLRGFNSLVVDKETNIKLVLVDGAPGWGKQLAVAENIVSNIIFTGALSDEQLAFFMQRAQALVMPSLYEGFGLPIIEAVGRCPVIASDIPVFRELQTYMPDLQLVDFNVPSLAEKLAKAMAACNTPLNFKSPECASQFTWPVAAEKICKLFSSLSTQGR